MTVNPQAQPAALREIALPSGVVVWMLQSAYAAIEEAGGAELKIRIGPSQEGWLTVTQAAAEHVPDVDGMTLEKAKSIITRAADGNKAFAWRGHGYDRRIEPTSFRAWRLKRRDANLDSAD